MRTWDEHAVAGYPTALAGISLGALDAPGRMVDTLAITGVSLDPRTPAGRVVLYNPWMELDASERGSVVHRDLWETPDHFLAERRTLRPRRRLVRGRRLRGDPRRPSVARHRPPAPLDRHGGPLRSPADPPAPTAWRVASAAGPLLGNRRQAFSARPPAGELHPSRRRPVIAPAVPARTKQDARCMVSAPLSVWSARSRRIGSSRSAVTSTIRNVCQSRTNSSSDVSTTAWASGRSRCLRRTAERVSAKARPRYGPRSHCRPECQYPIAVRLLHVSLY